MEIFTWIDNACREHRWDCRVVECRNCDVVIDRHLTLSQCLEVEHEVMRSHVCPEPVGP